MGSQRTTATGPTINIRGRLDTILLLDASGHRIGLGTCKMTAPAT